MIILGGVRATGSPMFAFLFLAVSLSLSIRVPFVELSVHVPTAADAVEASIFQSEADGTAAAAAGRASKKKRTMPGESQQPRNDRRSANVFWRITSRLRRRGGRVPRMAFL